MCVWVGVCVSVCVLIRIVELYFIYSIVHYFFFSSLFLVHGSESFDKHTCTDVKP